MGYLLAAYIVVLGTLAVYAVLLARRRRALLTQLASHGHGSDQEGEQTSRLDPAPGSPPGISG
jgi:hypothetical protein